MQLNNIETNQFRVVSITRLQLKELAICHRITFSESFNVKLGLRYVEKMLEWFLVSENRFLIGIEHKNAIIGYVGGAKGLGSTSGMIQHAYWRGIFSLALRPWLIIDPFILRNLNVIWKNKTRKRGMSTENNTLTKSIGLVVIGVDPSFRRQNIGQMLLKIFDKQCIKLNTHSAHLSVKSENYGAINAYSKNGWIVSETHKSSIEMSKIIV